MAPTQDEFADLMQRVLSGCMESTRKLHEEYGPHILRAVRRRLHKNLRAKFDSTDFVQDVWVSFFNDLPTRANFAEPEDLIAFLSRMASNKVAQVHRTRMLRKKHNINRERPLGQEIDAVDRQQPTPSEVVMGREAWDELLKGLRPLHRAMLMLLR